MPSYETLCISNDVSTRGAQVYVHWRMHEDRNDIFFKENFCWNVACGSADFLTKLSYWAMLGDGYECLISFHNGKKTYGIFHMLIERPKILKNISIKVWWEGGGVTRGKKKCLKMLKMLKMALNAFWCGTSLYTCKVAITAE